ncbi:hypothetical protein BIV24_28965 [Streptomyces colonosanans]|uniref:Uncharacterized protein n=1 Tax=Streptomyces colonosanans TaxID=1428652 RepID=A0A1S2NUI4_9ACTN|nr:hypothetical protein BIV24_28965 [Streptomyces colonosanans]
MGEKWSGAEGTWPDGREAEPSVASMRAATRALRSHLGTLPAVFHFDGPADQFLAEAAFPYARWRYACADSLLGSGIGGTVVGAMARSLFDDGLLWQWIAQSPAERRPGLLGSMLQERDRICGFLADHEATCPNLARWFVPLDGVTDLTGSSLEALAAPSLPGAAELMDLFLASSPARPAPTSLLVGSVEDLLQAARGLLAVSGMRGAVMVLAHAGHGNLLGLQSSLAAGGAAGHDLRADHEALFMHVAAVGVTVTLLGVCAAVPECWPPEIDQAGFLGTLMRLTENVVAAAHAVHGLGDPKPLTGADPKVRAKARMRRLRPDALVAHHEVLPDILHAGPVIDAVRRYEEFVGSWTVDPWAHGDPKLASVLAYGGAHSTFSTVMSTFDDHAAVATVFAARMLLEEAARFTWLTQDVHDEDAFVQRSTQYFDEFRAKKKATIATFAGNGVALAAATRLLKMPDHVVEGPETITKGRRPLPSIDKMLLLMGAPYPEPGWLPVAYSLLSQVTHSTPVGIVHMTRYREGVLSAHDISPEMLALALDVACLGSARLLGISGLLLSQGSDPAQQYAAGLERRAYEVHDIARMMHGLD